MGFSDQGVATALCTTLEVLDIPNPSSAYVEAVLCGLRPFPPQVVQRVVSEAAFKLGRRPVPRDFVDLARHYVHMTREDLRYSGSRQYNALIALGNRSYDLITDDWRVTYAITTNFGSLGSFYEEYEDQWKKKAFVDAYSQVDCTEECEINKRYYLEGNAPVNVGGVRLVNFLGCYEHCMDVLLALPNADHFQPPLAPDRQGSPLIYEPQYANSEDIKAALQELRA